MPRTGEEFTVTFHSNAPLKWGTMRRRNTRERRTGERYIPIPRQEAKRFRIANSNSGNGLGINIFRAYSSDGYFKGELKAAGCSKKGDVFAKQFQGNGNLQALEPWFSYCNIKIGDSIRIKWMSDVEIELTYIPNNG